ncbi:TPA: hypothetical protein I8W54_002109 [Morganella morganii]|nr:hypothetical protein [Morganella morganii]HAT1528359.1 hypothetical protein [Morganella morganii]
MSAATARVWLVIKRALWRNGFIAQSAPFGPVLFLLLSRRWWDYPNNAAAITLQPV